MKSIIFCFIFLFTLTVSAQIVSKDSVYHLKEVAISKKQKKAKTVTIKTKGEEMGGDIRPGQSIMNRFDVPDGELKTVTMYFNSGLLNIVKGPLNIEYQDTEFTLLIYDVDDKGKPGKSLIEEVKFIVKKKQRGALDIDVNALHLNVSGKLCIGLKREDKKSKKEPIALKIEINKNAAVFSRGSDTMGWGSGGDHWEK